MTLSTAASVLLMTVGALFMFVAALGVLRMPDLYLRISAAAKAGTLGVGSILAGVVIHFWDLELLGRAAAVVAFIALTTPVAAHVLGLAAYLSGVPLWRETSHDDLAEARGGPGNEGARPSPAPPPPAQPVDEDEAPPSTPPGPRGPAGDPPSV